MYKLHYILELNVEEVTTPGGREKENREDQFPSTPTCSKEFKGKGLDKG